VCEGKKEDDDGDEGAEDEAEAFAEALVGDLAVDVG
jgi:hypothetical protein